MADDGVDFPADFRFESRKSLGMHLVTSLAHQLRGRLALERAERNAISLTGPLAPSG